MAVVPLFGFLLSMGFLIRNFQCEVSVHSQVPFKALCSRKCATSEDKPPAFPLFQCSCSRSCVIYNDCCYDSQYRNLTIWHKTDFVCLSLVNHGEYRAVYSCPPDQLSHFCKDGLGYLPPVTSRMTNITYANIFCATCNGDGEDLVKWNVDLNCSSEPDGVEDSRNDTASRIIFNMGEIWRLKDSDGSKALCMYHAHYDDFDFLSGLELRSCIGHSKKVSDCSASWKDLNTMRLCRSYEDPVYFHNKQYRNPHCAECNYLNPEFADCMPFDVKIMLQLGLIDTKVGRFCEERGFQDCIQNLSNSLTGRGRAYSFAELLNINQKVCVPPSGKKCCEGEAFDFRSRRCRKTVSK